ncbi:MAG: hypothetical protein HS111_18550 [Kofleriaceae bacterium]|nr:hypothetical protein [Kofleriaceae bacterium]
MPRPGAPDPAAPDELSADERGALAHLYEDGEAPPAAAARAAGWRSVRDVVAHARREGFDEEPPARLDALLLAAARQHAPARAGVLERLRRWLSTALLQPAVKARRAVAVIGGTAGVLYLRGQVRVSEPTVGERAPAAPRFEAHPAGELAGVAGLDNDEASADDLHGAAPGAAVTGEGKLDEPGAGAGSGAETRGPTAGHDGTTRRRPLELPPPEQRHDRTATRGGPGGGGGNDLALDDRSDGRGVATVIATADDEVRGADRGGAGARAGAGASVEEKPAEPPPGRDGDLGGEDRKAGDATTSTPDRVTVTVGQGGGRTTVTNRAQAENLLRQARTAAARGDCAAVKVMARRVRALDPAYYTATFARDPELERCL